MSAFLDLEAGVDHEDIESSDSEDGAEDDFIVDEDGVDDTTDSPTADFFSDLSTPSVEGNRWDGLLERARARASTSETFLDGSEGFNFGLLDTAPGLWVLSCFPGWEDFVVIHIGRCARPGQGVRAAFIMPLMEKQVWLEADMSADLKSWLVGIPGVVRRNQQVLLHAVSPQESSRALLSTLTPALVPGIWVKVCHGPLKGDIGMVSRLYPWGCKLLLVPIFDPSGRTYRRQRFSPKSIPKLFDPAAVSAVEKEHSRYRSLGSTYEHDLLTRRVSFSQIRSAREIPDNLATLFARSRHPQVRRHIRSLPKISEWYFQVGEAITDTSRGRSGVIRRIGEHSLEVDFADQGLFPVRWADCRKEFTLGQYVEISQGTYGDRWSGWIHAIEDGMLHLISPHGTKTESYGVHPNAVIVIAVPNNSRAIPATVSPTVESTPNAPWRGTMVAVIKMHHRWRGKTGYVLDVNVAVCSNTKRRALQVLVQLAHYDPNAPFLCLWFPYRDLVEEQSWLPLNEAQPLGDKHEFFRDFVPKTNVLITKGRRIPPEPFFPEGAEEPGNATPLPDPFERCLSPAWNPLSPDPPSHWCLSPRLLGARFRVQYNGRRIVALVKHDCQGNIVCVRDDTPLGEALNPSRVLAIHPKPRHYDLFLVISGEHCGKWVRSIKFEKRSPGDNSDLDWTVAVVITRAPYLPDDVTDERLTLHNSMMTVAEETKESKALNLMVKKQLRLPSRD